MSDPFERFLLEDARSATGNGRYLGLAAFGKHPGWDDHLEDLGLETESLNLAKSILYVKGIGGQIDTGAWEKIEPAKLLPEFHHVFLWYRSGQALVGRLWSSSDGKGRKRYPMVLCFHFIGVPLSWLLSRGTLALAELAEQCIKTPSADEVRASVERVRNAMRAEVQSAEDLNGAPPLTSEALHEILQPSDSGTTEGFLRVLYQIQCQFGKFESGKSDSRSGISGARPEQIRVPAIGTRPAQSLWFWTQFFLRHIDASVPVLLILSLRENFLDVTAGEPQTQEFFCLRASTKGLPLASEVPYSLDEDFRQKAMAFFKSFEKADPFKASALSAGNSGSGEGTSSKTKMSWRKLLGG